MTTGTTTLLAALKQAREALNKFHSKFHGARNSTTYPLIDLCRTTIESIDAAIASNATEPTEQSEQEAFEKWISDSGRAHWLERDEQHGWYKSHLVTAWWTAWQKRASLAQPTGDAAGEPVAEVVSDHTAGLYEPLPIGAKLYAAPKSAQPAKTCMGCLYGLTTKGGKHFQDSGIYAGDCTEPGYVQVPVGWEVRQSSEDPNCIVVSKAGVGGYVSRRHDPHSIASAILYSFANDLIAASPKVNEQATAAIEGKVLTSDNLG